ncbi:unnamed protein product (macronuclear) [Paramecium tetraurelia]|uniref:Uncharacterized protein n=1 Tax=Paramecium tetraurelia TaxID=5888 RepID=A0DXY4_PARTE|nr:uncharacterized protein GSPATT00021525001 [Paramecium tetraurelia]CAK87901.1 unnamed protein product [Paramecium tetraurelia]|eukprot:XP_001455298.1 hypothetical protein (macronuclear) [Paramecium tetraurelia strain d4-2]
MNTLMPSNLNDICIHLSGIAIHVTEQIKNQNEQIQGMCLERQKTMEKLQKQLEKMNQVISRMCDKQPQQTSDQIQILKNQQYKYELQMEEELELPCYRNRIFQIKLKLVQNEKTIINVNNLLVELQIWTYDKIPKKLTHNNKNQSIFKGCQQTVIKKGYGKLSRIQIKEVSSHFPKGTFMMMIIPTDDGAVIGEESKFIIKKEWIKPLIINDVSIKAKKFSDRHNPYYAKSDGTINILEQE